MSSSQTLFAIAITMFFSSCTYELTWQSNYRPMMDNPARTACEMNLHHVTDPGFTMEHKRTDHVLWRNEMRNMSDYQLIAVIPAGYPVRFERAFVTRSTNAHDWLEGTLKYRGKDYRFSTGHESFGPKRDGSFATGNYVFDPKTIPQGLGRKPAALQLR